MDSAASQEPRVLAPRARRPLEFLIRDNDGKFTRGFDTVFNTEGVRVIRTPVRAPKANAVAERFVGTVRRECLDWLLIANRRHLQHVLREFVDHYNSHRPHRALELPLPNPGTRRQQRQARQRLRSACTTGSAGSSMSTRGRREADRRVCEPTPCRERLTRSRPLPLACYFASPDLPSDLPALSTTLRRNSDCVWTSRCTISRAESVISSLLD